MRAIQDMATKMGREEMGRQILMKCINGGTSSSDSLSIDLLFPLKTDKKSKGKKVENYEKHTPQNLSI